MPTRGSRGAFLNLNSVHNMFGRGGVTSYLPKCSPYRQYAVFLLVKPDCIVCIDLGQTGSSALNCLMCSRQGT